MDRIKNWGEIPFAAWQQTVLFILLILKSCYFFVFFCSHFLIKCYSISLAFKPCQNWGKILLIKNKRPILLLEVLIACAIVILCTTALLSPQVEMAVAQQRMVRDSELHHWVNYFYANQIVEKMYSKKIPWESIIDGQSIWLDSSRLAELAFSGSYKFTTIWHKPLKQEGTKNFYVMKVTFTFKDLWDKIPGTEEPRVLEYNYELFIEHNRNASEITPQKQRW